MMRWDHSISLNGIWQIDYLCDQPYTETAEPDFGKKGDSVTPCPVPGYWEDMTEEFRKTALHTKLKWNPLYTLQRYPQTGYVPDMALPNPVGCFVYKRDFSLSLPASAGDAELCFGGVQNAVSVWINGRYLGRHEGYSSAFSFKLPADTLRDGENRITIAVSNTRLKGYMERPVSGLTSRAANECTGGIYGDMELRFYRDGLRDVWVTSAADLSSFTVFTDGAMDTSKSVTILDGKKAILRTEIPAGKTAVTISAADLALWSPDTPKLYTAVVSTESQPIENRFGIRRLTVIGTKLYLNGKPYFFRGICEHCYHPLTVHPTRDKRYYRKVIRTLKELGFNSIRFHTYVPMAEYMEAADELGMLIEIETPNNSTLDQWCDIVRMARHYTAPVLYSSGNEMVIDEDYIEHLRACAKLVHTETDSVFSPMSAMRGIEYHSFGDCKVEEMAHAMGVSVEAELGRLVTGEAGSKEETDKLQRAEDFYTDPDEAEAFCRETGVDALAIAFGTAHGFYNAQPKLDFDVVKNVKRATGLPLVMHGGSGVSEEGFQRAIAGGIRKINYYSYMSKAGYEAARAEIEAGNSKYLHDVELAAMKAMKEDVKNAIRVFADLK